WSCAGGPGCDAKPRFLDPAETVRRSGHRGRGWRGSVCPRPRVRQDPPMADQEDKNQQDPQLTQVTGGGEEGSNEQAPQPAQADGGADEREQVPQLTPVTDSSDPGEHEYVQQLTRVTG